MKKLVYTVLILNISILLFSFNPSFKSEVPVGTVIHSVIPPAYFLSQNKKWVLLDGRPLNTNSTLSQIMLGTSSSMDSIPDARGMFIRSANYEGGADLDSTRLIGAFQNESTKLPTNRLIGVGIAKSDSLSLFEYTVNVQTTPKGEKDNGSRGLNYAHSHHKTGGLNIFRYHGKLTKDLIKSEHKHNVTVDSIFGGDSETRPKNISLYTYIKIN